jgi:rRNA methylase
MTDDPTAGSEPNAEPEVESESGSESELESTGQPHHQSETDESATASQSRNDPVVVVVDSETSGNIGTIARAMKNFGLDDLKTGESTRYQPRD